MSTMDTKVTEQELAERAREPADLLNGLPIPRPPAVSSSGSNSPTQSHRAHR